MLLLFSSHYTFLENNVPLLTIIHALMEEPTEFITSQEFSEWINKVVVCVNLSDFNNSIGNVLPHKMVQ